MTIQELIDQLQEAIKGGYPPETDIRADVFNDDGFYTRDNLLLDASSDYLPIPYLALNVYEDKVWKERYDKLTVHCLKCDEVYRETEPPVKECPSCGNTDKNKTVYLQGERE
tara:strand:- start:131 stop:466 length:336 start_codon:yes stop_codon:yes gene_type:complete